MDSMMLKKIFLILVLFNFADLAISATPQELLTGYEAQSGKASPARGETLFNAKHSKEWITFGSQQNEYV